jgi:excisionase family DNA binding protein
MPTLKELERWLTTSQAASKLGKTRQGVLWLLEEGRLRGVRTALGWLVDPEAVKEFEGKGQRR